MLSIIKGLEIDCGIQYGLLYVYNTVQYTQPESERYEY